MSSNPSCSARKKLSGLSVVELMVALSMTAVLLTATFFILQSSSKAWRRTSGSQDASSQLLKAESWLKRDLAQTSFLSTNSGPSLTTLVGRDGDALWFLSAIDPATGEFVRNDDGTPRWQRNVLYYAVVPNGLPASVFSGGGIEDGGYEVSHPAKVLIRKVIDADTPTIPTDEMTQETLLGDITPYLEAPNGSAIAAPGSESVSIIARELLGFRVARDDNLQSLNLVLQAARLKDRQLNFSVGSKTLLEPGILTERRLEVFPENRS